VNIEDEEEFEEENLSPGGAEELESPGAPGDTIAEQDDGAVDEMGGEDMVEEEYGSDEDSSQVGVRVTAEMLEEL
jgi:hypothetical protein